MKRVTVWNEEHGLGLDSSDGGVSLRPHEKPPHCTSMRGFGGM